MAATVTLTTINSSKNATSYLWDLGDFSSSTLQNPTHNYSISGVYVVRLTASGPGGSATQEQVISVQTGAPVTYVTNDQLVQLSDDHGNSLTFP